MVVTDLLNAARLEILAGIENADPPKSEEVAFFRYMIVSGMLKSFPELVEELER